MLEAMNTYEFSENTRIFQLIDSYQHLLITTTPQQLRSSEKWVLPFLVLLKEWRLIALV